MLEIVIIILSILGFLSFVLWQSRKQSIINIPSRNRHFSLLGEQLNLNSGGDEYFLQLEGTWNGFPILIYPHNFEGPGLITLFYADTGVPFVERSWVEPYLSLGRAIVEGKKGYKFQFEYAGNPNLKSYPIVEVLERYRDRYPYLAVTLPERFAYSQYVLAALSKSNNYIAIVVMDSGRRPALEEIQDALDAVTDIAETVKSTLGKSANHSLPEESN
jgi:hypothetical protein